MKLPPPVWLGFVAGFVLGLGDYLLLRALSVTMLVDGRDVTFWVVLFFALNFGALGAVIARLWQQRRELATQTEVIGRQYRQLEAAQAALVEQETLAAVGRMSAGVAHEVRNPLGVIRSSAQFLARDVDGLGEEAAEAARFVCEEVDRLDDFVRRVLELSRPIEVRVRPTGWDELAGRLSATVGADVEIVGEGVFDLDGELTVRLLSSLADNARKAGEGVRVRVEAREGTIEVVDDGPGIPAEHRDAVFEPFFTTRADGSGLGLTMARKLARLQGWELALLDDGGAPGRGARFRLYRRAAPQGAGS